MHLKDRVSLTGQYWLLQYGGHVDVGSRGQGGVYVYPACLGSGLQPGSQRLPSGQDQHPTRDMSFMREREGWRERGDRKSKRGSM